MCALIPTNYLLGNIRTDSLLDARCYAVLILDDALIQIVFKSSLKEGSRFSDVITSPSSSSKGWSPLISSILIMIVVRCRSGWMYAHCLMDSMLSETPAHLRVPQKKSRIVPVIRFAKGVLKSRTNRVLPTSKASLDLWNSTAALSNLCCQKRQKPRALHESYSSRLSTWYETEFVYFGIALLIIHTYQSTIIRTYTDGEMYVSYHCDSAAVFYLQ